MKSYSQFCPVAKAAELFCERWNALIIRDLAAGPRRFSDLKRGVPLMSPSLLSSRLKWLSDEGVIAKRAINNKRPHYFLTEAGQEFVPLIEALGVWGRRWTRRELQDHEIDLGLMVWSIESTANPGAFGDRRCLVRLELTDQIESKRLWWFLNENGRCQLCVEDPGGAVDLFLGGTLSDVIRIIRGDMTLTAAVASDRLEIIGDSWAERAVKGWLNLGPLTNIPSRLDETNKVAGTVEKNS